MRIDGDVRMKGFKRGNPLFSLCGLNCGLCPMKIGGHCSGCGFGNQSCKIAKCSLEHGNVEYCFQCEEYPCGRYEHIDDYDSFITHQHRKLDLEKAEHIGMSAYNQEQEEKSEILEVLLSDYNDGRRKTFYCVAVNLLEIGEIKGVLKSIEEDTELRNVGMKEKSAYVVKRFKELAENNKIDLKLRKKKS